MTANDDLHRWDKLTVSIKTERLGRIAPRYRDFAWEETGRAEHERFDNVTNVSFRRPHKIAHKDRLQFLQVGMEITMNAYSRAEQKKYAATAAFALTAEIAACALTAGGIVLAVLLRAAWAAALGCAAAAAGAAGAALCVPRILRLKAKDERRFAALAKETEKTIGEICAEARALTEGQNE